MATGTVKWFNTTKGFGFIAPDAGGSDVFVHISAVERAGLTGLADNQKIEYELQEGRDGRASAGDLALVD
ncbi:MULTISPECIES: cold-shock protein [Halocynthiibacter]|uniref:Cold-shock protein n=1 Tax=Halocynthiibacter halioticoli TaxID=2986804 RepID=A0AAE3LSQ9_9RHOB|nr:MULTISPECIES: cold-shock protein [Halocynthiibacter]MCV6823811.1 cold-shock protein [Halocynthiibacter halioticoli]MCW4056812.1 cold-shock protein [Halocynthiibacter sp. SDUM655004]MDE0590170.1 cold-shock protein [Halocynthiibacter sp. C4]